MVNGYIRPLSVENHKTHANISAANNGSSLNLNSSSNNNNSSTSRNSDFKSSHSQSTFNLDSGTKKTKNFLQEKSAVSFKNRTERFFLYYFLIIFDQKLILPVLTKSFVITKLHVVNFC